METMNTTTTETREEAIVRVKRCLDFITSNPGHPWHLALNASWRREVEAEAVALGLKPASKAPCRGSGRPEGQPDFEAMILARQEPFYGGEL